MGGGGGGGGCTGRVCLTTVFTGGMAIGTRVRDGTLEAVAWELELSRSVGRLARVVRPCCSASSLSLLLLLLPTVASVGGREVTGGGSWKRAPLSALYI